MTIQSNKQFKLFDWSNIYYRLFVLSFARNAKGDHWAFFSNYYVLEVKIKYFNIPTDRKSFFDLPIKIKEEAYKKIIKMSRNNDYATGNFLDFASLKENYRLFAIDFSKQTKLKYSQQLNFIDLSDTTMEQ